jgi:hypothetical protein
MVAAPSVYHNVAALSLEHVQLSTGLSCFTSCCMYWSRMAAAEQITRMITHSGNFPCSGLTVVTGWGGNADDYQFGI